MATLSEDKIRKLMYRPNNIRNMSIIAHVDHGKTTLTDSLVQEAGIISDHKAGQQRYTDTRKDEQERCITIKSTAISMFYKMKESRVKRMKIPYEGDEFLINLIDSPGHVDFSSEVTAALRLTDGAVVVVSNAAGVCVQTRTVLRQALSELVKPILFMNKLDSSFAHGANAEEVYQAINKAIENINLIIHSCVEQDSPLGDCRVDPLNDSVVFGSGLNCWAFRINDIAQMITALKMSEKNTPFDIESDEFYMAAQKLAVALWGEYYIDTVTGKTFKSPGENRERTFNYFVLDVIRNVFKAENDTDAILKLIRKVKHDFVIPRDAIGKEKNEVFRLCMKSFMPAGTSLLDSIVKHLPSPRTSQAYRARMLYTGEQTDASATGIKSCDPNGPLMIYVSKMVPYSAGGRFVALGRVFSGTISTSTPVRIIPADYNPPYKMAFENKKVKGVVILLAANHVATPDVPCGNICGLIGVDEFLVRSGTIASEPDACPIKTMKFSVSAIMQKVIWPKKQSDIAKLTEGITLMVKADPIVTCKRLPDGKFVISGSGEMHLDICLKDLVEMYAKNIPIESAPPIVEYKETLLPTETLEECRSVVSKSPNNHNRLRIRSFALNEEIVASIENGKINAKLTPREVKKVFVECKVLSSICNDIWKFAPEQANQSNYGCNLMNNATSGLSYLNETKELIIKGFVDVASEGPVTGSELRGVAFNLEDGTFHSDAVHRGAAQITPCSRSACIATMLLNNPRIVEPWFVVEVEHPYTEQGNVNAIINRRGGRVEEIIPRGSNNVCTVAYMPVRMSFDLLVSLRQATSGTAFPSCSFSHWAILDECPFDPPVKVPYNENAGSVARETRLRHGLSEKMPVATDYYDLQMTKMS